MALAVDNARLYREAQSAVTAREDALQLRDDLLQREHAAREEAEMANRSKDEFLATVSHELRTPLNAILGWAHMLRASTLDSTAQTRALETIERNARSQAQLIEDILDVSRIVTGKLRLDVRPVEVASVVEGAIDADAAGSRRQRNTDRSHSGSACGSRVRRPESSAAGRLEPGIKRSQVYETRRAGSGQTGTRQLSH